MTSPATFRSPFQVIHKITQTGPHMWESRQLAVVDTLDSARQLLVGEQSYAIIMDADGQQVATNREPPTA